MLCWRLQSLCLSNGVHWLCHSTFFSDISAFEWATSEAIQGARAAGLLGGPAELWPGNGPRPPPRELHQLCDQRQVRQGCPLQNVQCWTKADRDRASLFKGPAAPLPRTHHLGMGTQSPLPLQGLSWAPALFTAGFAFPYNWYTSIAADCL